MLVYGHYKYSQMADFKLDGFLTYYMWILLYCWSNKNEQKSKQILKNPFILH